MNAQLEATLSSHDDAARPFPARESHPSSSSSRKSRSISRYFLGSKRSSMDYLTQEHDIQQCLSSLGVFDTCELWTYVTLFRDYRTCRRLFIITNQNQLIIGKANPKQPLFKIKHRLELNRLWLLRNASDSIVAEITSVTYFDPQRSCVLGWPLADNFLLEFHSRELRETWCDRIQATINAWWRRTPALVEHVRVCIDPNQESDSGASTPNSAFLIRKMISIRPQETVRDLIQKCLDTSHLRDSAVDNYILYVVNDSNAPLTQTQLIPLIGHEYPYAIKMKHLKKSNHLSLDNDDQISFQSTSTLNSQHYPSTTSLNNLSISSHDFELKKRELDGSSKKHRFFPKRKPKEHSSKPPLQLQKSLDDSHSSLSLRLKATSLQFFEQKLDDLFQKSHQQLPFVLQQLLEILYYKGPETTGIFRKVANTRSVKESIEKIERNLPLHEADLHPILAAGIFKHFLRMLPEPLFNPLQYENWKKCLRLPTLSERLTFARKSIVATLPHCNHVLLKGLICVLSRIAQESDSNGMNPFNLGLCVSNSLFKTESTCLTSGKQEADVMSSIVEFLIVNCSSLFGPDVLTCVPDKHIIVHQIPGLTRPNASSIESLDEVESSPHLLLVNRSRDSGLATSDLPLNDDSSEISEHFRQQLSPTPDWKASIAFGTGTVVTSIILPSGSRRNLKTAYKPSKLFLQREKLTNDTTDESDHNDSSIRSSTTTVQNVTIGGKSKRTKPISRHSSLGSNGQVQPQPPATLSKESAKRVTAADVKRSSSLKQFHRPSDHDNEDDDDDDEKAKQKETSSPKKKASSSSVKIRSTTKALAEESFITRADEPEQQDLDLTSEPLSAINQRLNSARSASFTSKPLVQQQQPKIFSMRSRYAQAALPPPSSERDRTFVHHRDSRPFKLGQAIQMKPMEDFLLSSANGKCRPCHRQNALRYKLTEWERANEPSAPSRVYSSPQPAQVTRHQSIERRPPMKSASFDINSELSPSEISWSVREKAKLFEQNSPSGNRENYV